MKVICFRGGSDNGKSTIVNRILYEKFGIKIFKHGKDSTLSVKYNDSLIGICGYGDTPDLLIKHLSKLKDDGCDLIICTSHPEEKFLSVLRGLLGNDIKYIDCVSHAGRTNQSMDDERYSIFEKMFDGMMSVK